MLKGIPEHLVSIGHRKTFAKLKDNSLIRAVNAKVMYRGE